MAVTNALVKADLLGTETITSGLGSGVQDAQITHKMSVSASLTPSTSTPVSSAASFAVTLSGGTADIDLNAVTMANGVTADWTGIKLQALGMQVGTSEAVMTIATGASSAYAFGGAAFSCEVEPGGTLMLYQNEAAPDISTSARYLRVSGTGTQSCQVLLLGG